MSLREQWYAARQQREIEIHERKQRVVEHRQRTVEFISDVTANRAAMTAALRESLSNFHSTLQANVAVFREETRSHQQEVAVEQAHQRAAYVAAMRDYVWGSTPSPSPGMEIEPPFRNQRTAPPIKVSSPTPRDRDI